MRVRILSLMVMVILAGAQAKPIFDLTDEEHGNAWEKSGEFEGDILVKEHDNIRNGLVNGNYRWPNRTLVYKIDTESFNEIQVEAIKEAFAEYHSKTCIQMRPKEENDVDYVLITGQNAQGCSSYVGRQGSEQILKLKPNKPGQGCFRKGTIIHELLHALGFYHQQSAAERDEYVKILWENITPGTEHNFKKYGESTVTNYNVTYDYNSVMHYSAYAFSKNKEMTIRPLEEGVKIGQREGLSSKDIAKLLFMYDCAQQNSTDVDYSANKYLEPYIDIDGLESLLT